VWNDVPHPLMYLRIHRPFMTTEPRSYSRGYSPLSAHTPAGPYFSLDNRDHWNGKSSFPNLKLFTSDEEKSREEMEFPRRYLHAFRHHHSPNIGRAHVESNDGYQRKWSDDDFENYFTQMRITPRPKEKDVDTTNVIHRPSESYRRESPITTPSPNETDESISGESLGTSSGNTLNSVNGSVGNTIPEKNKVVFEKIRMGLDRRTTIMIKNVPNKYTQVPHLMDWINGSKCLWSMLILQIQELMISCISALIFRIDASSPTYI